jgi:hypothetical protein
MLKNQKKNGNYKCKVQLPYYLQTLQLLRSNVLGFSFNKIEPKGYFNLDSDQLNLLNKFSGVGKKRARKTFFYEV